jgi:regulator of protease activity HflC (stomatin/prohibitin superfamily)
MVESSTPVHVSSERPITSMDGYVLLAIAFGLAALFAAELIMLVSSGGTVPLAPLPVVISLIALPLLFVLVITGFYMIQPNQAAAITLFGAYRGTDRTHGLRWLWPWLTKTRISVRANNVVSEKLKVNDQRGNPIEIAANVVWRVADTAQALFDVDDYKAFVLVQIEAAVRQIGSRYPYDDFEHAEVTLRGNHEDIARELRTELNARLRLAGITVDECGLTHLAYAPEIAGAMLRRQQAEAVIAARRKLVEGAVGMVELALGQLSERDVITLDDERRAAMVSNLMVVLCGERETQPIVNAGTLYQ